MEGPEFPNATPIAMNRILRLVADACSDMLVVCGMDGRALYINRAHADRTGYGLDDLHGRTHLDIIHPDDHARMRHVWKSAFSGEEHKNQSYRILTTSGSDVWLSSTLAPVVDERGEQVAVVIRSRDITERRLAGIRPRLERTWYPLLFKKAMDGIVAVNLNGDILFANKAAARNLGYTLPEFLRLNITDIEAKESRTEYEKHYLDMLQGKRLRFDTQHRRKDGSLADVEVSLGLFDHDGETVAFSFWRDISDHKRAEEALKRSGEKFRSIVDHANDGILIADTETRKFVEVNKTMCDMLGYTREEILGLGVENIHPPKDLPMVAAGFERFARNNQLIARDIPVMRKDETVFYADISHAALSLNGRTCALGIFHDITERKRLEKEIREAYADLEQRVQQRTRELQREIAERTKAEKALQQERDTARQYLDIAGVMLVAIGADLNIIMINKKGCDILGYTERELIGRNWFALIPEQARQSAKDVFAKLMNGDLTAVEYVENAVLNSKGEKRIIAWHNTIIRDGTGTIIGTLSSGEDITERKRSEDIGRTRLKLLEFAATHSLKELLQYALDEVCKLTDSPIGFYHVVEPDAGSMTLQAGPIRAVQEFCTAEGKGRHYSIKDAGSRVDAICQRKPAVHNDYLSVPHRKGLPPCHVAVSRDLVVPVFRENKIVAVMGLGNCQSPYTQQDVDFVSFLADIVWEISERKRAEEALRESWLRFRQLAENISEIFWVRDARSLQILYISPAYETIWGRTCQSLYNDPGSFIDSVHDHDKERVAAAMQRELDGTLFDEKYRIVRPDGSVRWIWTRTFPVRDASGETTRFVGVAEDITADRQAEEAMRQYTRKLRALSQRLVDIQESERRSIARELHDAIGQLTTGLKLGLDMLSQTISGDTAAQVKQLQTMAVELLDRARNLSLSLRPAMLDDLGLLPTLIWHFERYTARTGIRVRFTQNGMNQRLPPKVETALYRVTQEALTNVARHAGVLSVDVAISASDRAVRLTVEDGGRGFNADDIVSGKESIGLFGMRERAESIGGTLTIESSPGRGTTIAIAVPLHPDRPAGE